MNNHTRVAFVLGLIASVLLMFWYSSMKRNELQEEGAQNAPSTSVDSSIATSTLNDRINAVHFFSKGAHTIVGELMMPTACDLPVATTTVSKSQPEEVMIILTTVNNQKTCAQVLTPQRFRVDFAASKDARIQATLSGANVILNLRDAEPGAVPEKLEDLYFKG